MQGVSGIGGVGGHVNVGHGLEGGGYAGAGAGAGGATAAALSLMHALPLHYLGPAPAPDHHPHWDQAQHHANDKQVPPAHAIIHALAFYHSLI